MRWLLAVLLISGVAQGAPISSDAGRLNAGLPSGFRRTEVLVYPPVDHRPHRPGATDPLPEAWTDFLSSLSARANLRVHPPQATVSRLRQRPGYRRTLSLARATARRGQEDYGRVKLKRAADELQQAIQTMVDLEHHVVDPNEVSRLALLRAQALLEAGQRTAAAQAFQTALQLNPSVHLVPGTDSPAAIAALEAARTRVPAAQPPRRHDHGPRTWVLRTRVEADQLVVTVQSAGGLREARILLTTPDAGDRLASRVWACLPFGRAARRGRDQSRLYLDAGFNYDVFLNSSAVDLFSNFGAGLNLSWLIQRNLSLDTNLAVTNSNRDRHEDLREDVSAIRLFVGPGFAGSAGPFRANVGLGFSAETLSEITTTRNVACKFYLDSPLCDVERDLDQQDRVWRVGVGLSVAGSVRLVDRIYLSLRVLGSTSIFETADNGIGFPLGAQFGLGYRLY